MSNAAKTCDICGAVPPIINTMFGSYQTRMFKAQTCTKCNRVTVVGAQRWYNVAHPFDMNLFHTQLLAIDKYNLDADPANPPGEQSRAAEDKLSTALAQLRKIASLASLGATIIRHDDAAAIDIVLEAVGKPAEAGGVKKELGPKTRDFIDAAKATIHNTVNGYAHLIYQTSWWLELIKELES